MEIQFDLNLFWFAALGVLLTGYAILDGFDLGVGIVHLAARGDEERRLLINSIGPLWDGNAVWLVTFGGALFAAFPNAYATAFSGFYMPFMMLLFALIFRAVSMEFRSKKESKAWRGFWDAAFSFASITATFIFGVAVGNSMQGLPIGADMEFAGELSDLIRPFPLLVGALAVSIFAMHGSIYLYMKVEGELQTRIRNWIWRSYFLFLTLFAVTSAAVLHYTPHALRNFQTMPWAWIIVVLNVLSVANIPRSIFHNKPFNAFVSSACTIAALNFLFGIALFPNLILSSLGAEYNLDIYNSASSQKTLGLMRIIAFMGLPFICAYTAVIYWVFRGKVSLNKTSY